MTLTQEQLNQILGNSQQWNKLPYTPMQSPSGLGIDYLKKRYQEVTTPQPAKPMTKQEAMDFALGIAPLGMIKQVKVGDIGFDPRFDKRKLEQTRLKNLTTRIDVPEYNIPKVSLADYEGRPFITTMSDRTNVGSLLDINGVPVGTNMQGGQGFMFDNPMVWASAQKPTSAIMKNANILQEATGQNPLLLPWRMAPTGGDFANMTGETMLRYMSNNMSKSAQRDVNKSIKDFIPTFKGVGSEEGIDQFRTASDKTRKALKKMLDKKYRNEGGLSIGEARLAVSDPNQYLGKDAGIMNVGEVFAQKPIITNSGHKAYPRGVAGQGLGTLDKDFNIFQLLPNVAKERNIIDPLNPSQQDIRALQMKPYAGMITPELLKKLGY
jgi:hypothetical protein